MNLSKLKSKFYTEYKEAFDRNKGTTVKTKEVKSELLEDLEFSVTIPGEIKPKAKLLPDGTKVIEDPLYKFHIDDNSVNFKFNKGFSWLDTKDHKDGSNALLFSFLYKFVFESFWTQVEFDLDDKTRYALFKSMVTELLPAKYRWVLPVLVWLKGLIERFRQKRQK